MPAYYRNTLEKFLSDDEEKILGHLADGVAEFDRSRSTQTRTWQADIQVLKACCKKILESQDSSQKWGLLLEYPIPRRGKRVDAIILAETLIFVIEFKPSNSYESAEKRQVEDYSLDLRDFHEESFGRIILPILVAKNAGYQVNPEEQNLTEKVKSVIFANQSNLSDLILSAYSLHSLEEKCFLNLEKWDNSKYNPVPTIIEAAETLFAGHCVADIARASSSQENLKLTSQCIVEAIGSAQTSKSKIICFLTGVPGAGKTLAGLTITHDPAVRSEDRPAGVFLSGNVPLVKILREALARDSKARGSYQNKQEAKRVVETFVQNVHVFLNEYASLKDLPPERVVVFDEAQRAWDQERLSKKSLQAGKDPDVFNCSEPELFLRIMDRHDWSVVLALVGGGQEIHYGEGGLAEWGKILSQKFSHWKVYTSPQALHGDISLSGQKLFSNFNFSQINVTENKALHLSVSRRSYKAEKVSSWVDYVLKKNSNEASQLISDLGDYPIVLTRSLESARQWLRQKTRGLRRCGLVASSRALRLRADGIELNSDFRHSLNGYADWFLSDKEDVRSSFQLEVAATEFECQGLELDWTGVCWGDDFLLNECGEWIYRKLHGSKWQQFTKEIDQQYLINKYRVILTRARLGMVLYVPLAKKHDLLRDNVLLNNTACFLQRCGLKLLDQKP